MFARLKKRRCEKRGHRWRKVRREGYRWPSQHIIYAVADSIVQERTQCARCLIPHPEEGEWKDVSSYGLDGLTLNTEWYNKLHENHILITRVWYAP